MKLAGHTIKDVLYAVDETVVARAESTTGERVVLKYQDGSRPSLELAARWQHEHAVLQSIDSEWVIKSLALKQVEHNLILVLEDFGTTNLARLIERPLLDLADRLALAIQLATAIGVVHQHRLIHGDVSPKNVLVDVATMRLKLCDFALSTRLDSEQGRSDVSMLRGTLDYMSPEQTGRTNLDIDYRSDFYSLGVTLYEMFAGHKPFRAADPMTLLHQQIAVMPPPLHELDPAIPEGLSNVVHKLLAKYPDERYQSSFGLLHDLRHCETEYHRYRRIDAFALGGADVPERFCIAQKLYGRERERDAILAAFERVGGGRSELLLVGGYSGIGKTALVSELHRPVVARRGYFLRGKCDQYRRNQPYAALSQAFAQLVRQLAVEGEERRDYWRTRLHDAVGENAAAVCDLVPNLPLLIGTPPPLPFLPPAESEQRLHIAFAQFVKALADPSHPLLLFLDDLQWADAPTLTLIEHLVRDEADSSLLIVGAYRDNEVDADHLLLQVAATIERRQGALTRLQLDNLAPNHVLSWLADTLHCAREAAAPLADLCLEKTEGNPFFLSQFLRHLHDAGDIRYDRDHGVWRWDLAQIRGRQITDNVVELMLQKMRALDPHTQELLAIAANLGERFDQRQLMAVGRRDAATTAAVLWPALHAGLVVPLSEDYKFEQAPLLLQSARYRFLHDRVQQAAFDLTPPTQRRSLQLRCGRLLLASSTEAELEERLFIILEAMNSAASLIDDPAERAQLLALNLRGGIRAKAASAHATAVSLLRQAKQLLPADAGEAQPAQTLQLYKELAEAEYLAGNFDAAEQLYPQGIAACRDPLAQVTLYLVQSDQYHIQGRFEDSFHVLLRALDLLRRPFPADEAGAGQLFPGEFAQTEQQLAQYTHDALLQLPEMREPAHLLEMRLYLALTFATYQVARFNGFVVAACRLVQTTLAHGQCDLSCVAYVAYLTAMSAAGRPYHLVHAMGRLAVRQAEQRDNQYFRLTVYQYFGPFYQHWGEPLQATYPYLDKGIELGMSGINPLSAGYCTLLRGVNKFIQGVSLDELEAECERGLKFLQQSRQPKSEVMLRLGVLQPLRALAGRTFDPLSFDSAEYSSSAFFQGDYSTPSIPLALRDTAMLRHAYLLGDRAAWAAAARNLAIVGLCLPDSPSMVEATFYAALGQLRPGFVDTPDIALVEATIERFRVWSEGCVANFRHKQLILSAELARARGEDKPAMDLYAQAIEAAFEAGFTPCEALANELYARFWASLQQKQLASNFIRDAYYHYRRWGAVVKCRQLESEWPDIAFRLVERRYTSDDRITTFRVVSEQTGMLDLHSLLKANHLLAQEIHLDALLQKMLAVLLENAGAERGAIVLDEDGQLIVEAIGGLGDDRRIKVNRPSLPLAEQDAAAPLLPRSVIRYVQLSRATLVLNDASRDERFARDDYLTRRQPRSVMCLPVVTQGKLVALVYLENNLLGDAFTARQQKTLELLSAQAAISLVNARLYESLEEKVQQRTEELRRLSMRDGLTGIANRRSFDERIAVEWRRSQRHAHPLSLLMLDIDLFKQYNDHYGHLEGDACIKAVATALERVVSRPADVVARYGGEEFAILLPDTDAAAAEHVAQGCIAAIAALALPHAKAPLGRVSLSIGCATLTAPADGHADTLIGAADKALYEAKRAGRNRCCVAAAIAAPAAGTSA